MAPISATQSEAVCSAFCNVTLGLAIHAMFNVADGTLSALLYAFRNVFPFGSRTVYEYGRPYECDRLMMSPELK